MRDVVDENDLVGQPPLGNLALHELQDFVPAGRLFLLENHDQQRPLVPLWMLDADDRRLCHFGMPDGEILELDRGNPLTAGFDYVLGAVGHVHITIAVDG
jgi:hypothetical protein